MKKAKAHAVTENASKYLQQLCKHFRHKVPAEYDEYQAKVDFPFGLCLMSADDTKLSIDCETPDEEAFTKMKFVLDDHLERFAWKEKLKLSWKLEDNRK